MPEEFPEIAAFDEAAAQQQPEQAAQGELDGFDALDVTPADASGDAADLGGDLGDLGDGFGDFNEEFANTPEDLAAAGLDEPFAASDASLMADSAGDALPAADALPTADAAADNTDLTAASGDFGDLDLGEDFASAPEDLAAAGLDEPLANDDAADAATAGDAGAAGAAAGADDLASITDLNADASDFGDLEGNDELANLTAALQQAQEPQKDNAVATEPESGFGDEAMDLASALQGAQEQAAESAPAPASDAAAADDLSALGDLAEPAPTEPIGQASTDSAADAGPVGLGNIDELEGFGELPAEGDLTSDGDFASSPEAEHLAAHFAADGEHDNLGGGEDNGFAALGSLDEMPTDADGLGGFENPESANAAAPAAPKAIAPDAVDTADIAPAEDLSGFDFPAPDADSAQFADTDLGSPETLGAAPDAADNALADATDSFAPESEGHEDLLGADDFAHTPEDLAELPAEHDELPVQAQDAADVFEGKGRENMFATPEDAVLLDEPHDEPVAENLTDAVADKEPIDSAMNAEPEFGDADDEASRLAQALGQAQAAHAANADNAPEVAADDFDAAMAVPSQSDQDALSAAEDELFGDHQIAANSDQGQDLDVFAAPDDAFGTDDSPEIETELNSLHETFNPSADINELAHEAMPLAATEEAQDLASVLGTSLKDANLKDLGDIERDSSQPNLAAEQDLAAPELSPMPEPLDAQEPAAADVAADAAADDAEHESAAVEPVDLGKADTERELSPQEKAQAELLDLAHEIANTDVSAPAPRAHSDAPEGVHDLLQEDMPPEGYAAVQGRDLSENLNQMGLGTPMSKAMAMDQTDLVFPEESAAPMDDAQIVSESQPEVETQPVTESEVVPEAEPSLSEPELTDSATSGDDLFSGFGTMPENADDESLEITPANAGFEDELAITPAAAEEAMQATESEAVPAQTESEQSELLAPAPESTDDELRLETIPASAFDDETLNVTPVAGLDSQSAPVSDAQEVAAPSSDNLSLDGLTDEPLVVTPAAGEESPVTESVAASAEPVPEPETNFDFSDVMPEADTNAGGAAMGFAPAEAETITAESDTEPVATADAADEAAAAEMAAKPVEGESAGAEAGIEADPEPVEAPEAVGNDDFALGDDDELDFVNFANNLQHQQELARDAVGQGSNDHIDDSDLREFEAEQVSNPDHNEQEDLLSDAIERNQQLDHEMDRDGFHGFDRFKQQDAEHAGKHNDIVLPTNMDFEATRPEFTDDIAEGEAILDRIDQANSAAGEEPDSAFAQSMGDEMADAESATLPDEAEGAVDAGLADSDTAEMQMAREAPVIEANQGVEPQARASHELDLEQGIQAPDSSYDYSYDGTGGNGILEENHLLANNDEQYGELDDLINNEYQGVSTYNNSDASAKDSDMILPEEHETTAAEQLRGMLNVHQHEAADLHQALDQLDFDNLTEPAEADHVLDQREPEPEQPCRR